VKDELEQVEVPSGDRHEEVAAECVSAAGEFGFIEGRTYGFGDVWSVEDDTVQLRIGPEKLTQQGSVGSSDVDGVPDPFAQSFAASPAHIMQPWQDAVIAQAALIARR
jgi:hypothetical protein